MWDGIQVYGDKTKHQFTVTNPTHQGYLYLNNAVIENARWAVQLWEAGNWDATGGVVRAVDSEFRNNRVSVVFMNYENKITGSIEYDNLSIFDDCDFIVDINYLGTNPNDLFKYHVSCYKTKGVKFYSCGFYNNQPTKSINDSENYGIVTASAGIRVRAITGKTSTFSGFNKAIFILGGSSTASTSISNTDFTNNFYGIDVLGSSSISLTNNTFDLTTTSIAGTVKLYGVELENNTGVISKFALQKKWQISVQNFS